MAKRVLSIRRFRSLASISNLWPNSPAARSGKSSGASVCSVKREWPERSDQPLLLGIARHLHLGAVGELAHDVVQHVRRHRHRAGLRDVGRRLVRHLALEVGRLELQRPVRGLEQDVGEDGNGGAPLDHARHVTKRSEKLTAFDHQLHEPASPVAPCRGADALLGAPLRSLRKIEKASDLLEGFAVPAGWTAATVVGKARDPQFPGIAAPCRATMQERRACAAPPRCIRPPSNPLWRTDRMFGLG